MVFEEQAIRERHLVGFDKDGGAATAFEKASRCFDPRWHCVTGRSVGEAALPKTSGAVRAEGC
jgi:hypothetical protein